MELMVEGEVSLSIAVLVELGVSRWLLPDEEGLNAKIDCEYWYCDGGDDLGTLGGFVSIIYNQPKTLQWSFRVELKCASTDFVIEKLCSRWILLTNVLILI